MMLQHFTAPAAAGAAQQQQQQRSAALGVANLAGPGGCWRVLPNGNTDKLPEVPGRAGVVVTSEQPIGEFAELEQLGAAPFLLQRFREYGPVFSWMLGPTKMTTVVDYDAVKSLLQLGDSKVIVGWNPEAFYAMLGERTRKSLEDPATRLNNRRMMQPGFTKEALTGYTDKGIVFVAWGSLIKICTKQLDAWAAAEGPVDLAAEGKDLSFEFSTQLLVDFDISPEQKHQLRDKFDALFQGIFSPPDPTPGSRFSKGIEARGQLLEDIEQLVRAREAREQHTGNGNGSAAAATRKNVFDYTLDQQREESGAINYAEAASSGIGLIIAGNDTSGLGVSALLATLPLFPEVVEKLRQEQQQVIKRHGEAITLPALDAMPYADAVIRETLRIAPPSAAVFRRALVDLEVCGKFVPAGSPLMLSSFMGQVLTDPRLNLSELSPPTSKPWSSTGAPSRLTRCVTSSGLSGGCSRTASHPAC
ncbi:cytochrome P450 [Scenedesmus sp. NREL 46B-D3]|nr:cytochrome P450 [Scenedesmus sp. NREL 46B-D3]